MHCITYFITYSFQPRYIWVFPPTVFFHGIFQRVFPPRYIPAEVDHGTGIPGTGTFLLHQGIQRRIGFTVMYDNEGAAAPHGGGEEGDDRGGLGEGRGGLGLIWRDARELVVGRVRNTPDWRASVADSPVLSLSMLPAHYIKQDGDDRSAPPPDIKFSSAP